VQRSGWSLIESIARYSEICLEEMRHRMANLKKGSVLAEIWGEQPTRYPLNWSVVWARKPLWKFWNHKYSLNYLNSEINTLYTVLFISALVHYRMDQCLIREKRGQNSTRMHSNYLNCCCQIYETRKTTCEETAWRWNQTWYSLLVLCHRESRSWWITSK